MLKSWWQADDKSYGIIWEGLFSVWSFNIITGYKIFSLLYSCNAKKEMKEDELLVEWHNPHVLAFIN